MNGRIGIVTEHLYAPAVQQVASILVVTALGALFASFIAHAAPAVQEKHAPAVAFELNAVVVTQVTPRAQVILFGVERQGLGFATRTTEVSLSMESDQRGVARFDLQRAIAPGSIYAAVDAVSGGFAVASPGGDPLEIRPAQALRLRGKTGQDFEAFDLDGHWIEVLCVRPGQGGWRVSLMDESSVDESPVRGAVGMGAAHMKAIGNGPPTPVKFRSHDVLIAIDPYSMTVVATAVNE